MSLFKRRRPYKPAGTIADFDQGELEALAEAMPFGCGTTAYGRARGRALAAAEKEAEASMMKAGLPKQKCQGCGADIAYIRTERGRALPVNLPALNIVTEEGGIVRGFTLHPKHKKEPEAGEDPEET